MSTRAIALGRPSTPGAPLNTPLVPATNFLLGGQHEYARDANPTSEAFEEVVGSLEGGQATAFASGMAAIEASLSIGVAQASNS
ncbi:PLP-dependent transferase, partial [Arthrospira platensis SPKY1]|nr:PLP-dependent transferase [Arthrospira platensis SPKY1]